MECLTCKSSLPLVGDAWMQQTLKQFTALANPELTVEKAAALKDLLGDELFNQTVTTKATRAPTFHDQLGGVSAYIVSRGGMTCL